MADRKQLEELFISLILEDKKLEAQYRQVVERAKSVAKEIQTAIAGSLSTDLVDEKALDGAFDSVTRKAEGLKRALETAGQAQQAEAQASKTAAETITQAVESSTNATRNAAQAATGAMTDLGGAADKAADAATDLSGATRDTADSGRSFAEWATKMRQRLEDMRAAVRQDIDALDGLSDVQIEVASTGERLTLSQEELDEVIKSLTAQVASQRNLWASRVTSDKEFEDSTRALRQELLGFVEAGVLTDQQMRRVTQSAAYAQRGLDSVAGVASRGGLAWTTQIALSNQFGQSLRRLGPAGEVASQALGLVSKEMRALLQVNTGDLFGSIIGGLGRLSLAAGAAAAAVVTGVTVALFKMGQTAAESAEKLLTSATRASLSVETFQEYAFAAEQSGVQVEILTTTMQRLQRRAVDAQRGNAGLAESFNRLGVTLVDAQGKMLSTEELFGQVADGLVGIESDAERVALAFKIFDTEGAKLLPMLQRGSDGIQEMRDRARELGLILSGDAVMSLVDFKNSVNEAQKQLETSKIEILAGFMPAFTNLLIPLIQNTVVPWFQRLAEKVNEFTTSLRDVGPAGREFRSALAESLAPLVQIQGYAQAAGASLDILNYKFQLSGAEMNAFWRQAGHTISNLPGYVKRFFGIDGAGPAPQPDGGFNQVNINKLKADVEEAEAKLADAIYKINNPGAVTAEWVTQLANQVNETIGVLDGLGNEAESAYKKAMNPPPPPAGSLAALRQQLQEAQRDFELAVTNEARAAALERIRVKEGEINTITAMMNAADPFAAATAWTQRLAAELRFGIKTASEVFDLIFPRIEELREEAATALSDFGVDSVQYQETVGKLEILERLLQSLGLEAEAVDAVSMRGLQYELIALLNEGLEPTSEAVKELLRQMNELELRGALEELRSKGVANLSAWARSVLEANGLLSDAVRTVSLTPPVMTANILEQPLAKVRFLIHQFGSGVETDLGVARTAWDDFERNVALGAASLQSALNAPSEAFRIFQDTILQMMQSGESMQAIYDAIARSPFAEAFSLVGFGEPGDPTEQVGLLERAYAAQQAAYAELQSAMTEEAIVAAGERYAAAQEEVRRLEALYATPVDVTTLGESVREKVVTDLTAAGLAAQMFGTESELAAKQLTILEGAIMTLLAADPTAYVADLQMMWESIKGGAEGATEGVVDLTRVQNDLAAAQERLAQLTGEAPSEFDKLRGAFRAADAAGIEFGKTLEEILDLLDKLEEKADEVAAQQELANKLTLGVDIANGLTRSLEGIRDRDLQGALGGLTQLGTAIGTLIGGPAVGAIVQAIGQGLQAAVGLFQAISDLFTGDSPARRKLRDSLAQTVAGAFRSGIIDGLRGGEEWRENLKQNVQEAVLGAVVDAFIQAAVMQAIFAPFIDEFTKILHKSGVGAAFEFFDREFENFWQNAMQVVEGFVTRGQRYFKQAEQIGGPDNDPLQPVTFELPNATVGVLAAPQWALELGSAAATIQEAGTAMLTAAQMMQTTFQQGIPVTTESTRGIDAQRAL